MSRRAAVTVPATSLLDDGEEPSDGGGKAKAAPAKVVGLVIPPPDLRVAQFRIVGTAPYVQNRFSNRDIEKIRKTQEAGSQAKSKKAREPKDFEALYRGALHVSEDGWIGIPASAFRSAIISACRLVNFKMTLAKLSIFTIADGIDKDDGTPLVRIQGSHEKHVGAVRNADFSTDLRARPMWRKWSAVVNVKFDAGQFSATDVLHLLSRAGAQVGIGEGRPDSRHSIGMGWGTFEVESQESGRVIGIKGRRNGKAS